MIIYNSPIQQLLIAVEELVPDDFGILVEFIADQPGGELFGVALPEEGAEEQNAIIVLWAGLSMFDTVRVLMTALSVALSRDPGRGIRFCQWRNKIREAHEKLISD